MRNASHRTKSVAIAAGAALAVSLVAAAHAHQGATGVVKERMEMMKGMASAMKALAPMIQGKAKWDAGTAASSAETIATHAKEMPAKFPKGSTGHPSEASPEIWKKWEMFTQSAKDLATNASALKTAADDGLDASKPVFGKIVQSCKGCHESFREKH